MDVQSALHDFLEACQADGLRPATLTWYTSLLGTFAREFPDLPLPELTTGDLRRYLVGLRGRYSEDSVHGHTRALHRFFAWCSTEYDIPNPMRSIRYPRKPEPKPKAIAPNDVAALFQSCQDDLAGIRNRALLAFLWDTGCRAGGLTSLLIEDVDLIQRRALVTEKGGKSRAIVFTDFTARLLTRWFEVRQPSPLVFYSLDTLERLSPSGLRGILKRMARRAGVTGRVNPHSFRHGFAREYLDAGGDMATLARLLGHQDVSTTLAHYVFFTQQEIALKHEKFSPVKKLGGKV